VIRFCLIGSCSRGDSALIQDRFGGTQPPECSVTVIARDPTLNFFRVDASQPLSVWRAKGWIAHEDPRGWFQWYCRYYLGRRLAQEDARQIRRWKAMRRHIRQIEKHCERGDLGCRPRQRQALLQWAYDSRRI
jgi:hypothetical protein